MFRVDDRNALTDGLILPAGKLADCADWLRALPLHLIIAMVNRKDPKAFLKPLAPYVKSITIMEIEND